MDQTPLQQILLGLFSPSPSPSPTTTPPLSASPALYASGDAFNSEDPDDDPLPSILESSIALRRGLIVDPSGEVTFGEDRASESDQEVGSGEDESEWGGLGSSGSSSVYSRGADEWKEGGVEDYGYGGLGCGSMYGSDGDGDGNGNDDLIDERGDNDHRLFEVDSQDASSEQSCPGYDADDEDVLVDAIPLATLNSQQSEEFVESAESLEDETRPENSYLETATPEKTNSDISLHPASPSSQHEEQISEVARTPTSSTCSDMSSTVNIPAPDFLLQLGNQVRLRRGVQQNQTPPSPREASDADTSESTDKTRIPAPTSPENESDGLNLDTYPTSGIPSSASDPHPRSPPLLTPSVSGNEDDSSLLPGPDPARLVAGDAHSDSESDFEEIRRLYRTEYEVLRDECRHVVVNMYLETWPRDGKYACYLR